jgi:hypothetical protein
MAVNRFWGQAPVAEFTPTSMQEASFIPQQMYARDKEAQAQIDAMNESNMSLKSMLGDKANTAQDFEDKSQNIMGKLASQGSSPQLLDQLRGLRQTYIQQVVPMQEFAKQRQEQYSQMLKDKSNNDKIVMGQSPLDQSFDQWNKNGKILNPYQIVDRKELLTQGMINGKQWAESVDPNDPTKSWVDIKTGELNTVKGFKNADEVPVAYQNDPKFRNWVDARTQEIAQSHGVKDANPDVLNTIRSGIFSSVVGGIERKSLPGEILKNYLHGNVPMQKPTLATINPTEVSNMQVGSTESLLKNSPELLRDVDSRVSSLTGGRFKTLSDIDKNIDEWKASNPMGPSNALVAGRLAPNRSAVGMRRIIMPDNIQSLQDIKDNVLKYAEESKDWKNSLNISPDWVGAAKGGEDMKKYINNYSEAIGDNILSEYPNLGNNDAQWGGANQTDIDAIGKSNEDGTFLSDKSSNRKISFKGLNINLGHGAPVMELGLSYDDKSGKVKNEVKDKTVYVRVPYKHAISAANLFTKEELLGGTNPNDPNTLAIANAVNLMKRYYEVVQPAIMKESQK